MLRWAKRLLLGLLLLAGLYLLAANLFLNTPAGPWAVNRHPERVRVTWTSAWSFWPGAVEIRGLDVEGHSRIVDWSVAVERGRGWIDLRQLLGRELRVTDFRGEGARSAVVWRAPTKPTHGAPPRPLPSPSRRPSRPRRSPWTFRFARIALVRVQEIRLGGVRLAGSGRVEGGFSVIPGRAFRLAPSTLRMRGPLLAGGGTAARDLDLEATASIDPYSPRRYPGLRGFDFISGSLRAHGRGLRLAFLRRAGPSGRAARPGSLALDLRLVRGRLATGSHMVFSLPSDIALTGRVRGPGAPRLLLVLRTGKIAAGGPPGQPLLESDLLDVTAATRETRVSRLLATARALRVSGKLPAATVLTAEARTEGLRIDARGSRTACRLSLDRATGRVDVAALLRREVAVEGLRAHGVSGRLTLAPGPAPAAPGPRSPWSVRLADARLAGIREVGFGKFRLAGKAEAAASVSFDRDGTLAVERATFVLPDGSFEVAEETAARHVALTLDARADPFLLAEAGDPTVLRRISGSATIRGQVASLEFLRPYFRKTPWLAVQASGRLDAGVLLDHGRLAPGTHLTVETDRVEATFLDSLASGAGTVTAAVESAKAGPQTALQVRLRRFGVVDLGQRGRPAYLRGRDLRIAVTAPAVDLTAPVPDGQAVVDLRDAEVPNLAVYDDLLPAGAGLSILSGRGRAHLHFEVSSATRRTRGEAALTSELARVRFQNLELAGRLTLRAPLASPDLQGRRFNLAGTRLELDRATYRDVGGGQAEGGAPDWWARAELTEGSVVWGRPLSLRAAGRVAMRNSGPLLALFAERKRFLRWFERVLTVEDVAARGTVRLSGSTVAIDSLEARGGNLEVRSRMRFSKAHQRGDLLIEYGRLAAGIELVDGRRDFRLLRPRQWYEGRQTLWQISP